MTVDEPQQPQSPALHRLVVRGAFHTSLRGTGGEGVTLYRLSVDLVDPIGSDAKIPVIIAFLVFIGASLLWLFTLITGQQENPESLHVADRSLSPVVNGFAIAGEQISVSYLLAVTGAIVLLGYDGFTAAIDALITLGAMLLLAQKVRDSRRYTLGDLFALRATGPVSRTVASWLRFCSVCRPTAPKWCAPY